MKLTLAEAAMGASAVLEAPPTVQNAGALTVSGYSIDLASSGLYDDFDDFLRKETLKNLP